MNRTARAALLAAILTGIALPAAAQSDAGVSQAGATPALQMALSHMERTVQNISGDRRIPISTISLVNVHWDQMDAATQAQLVRAMTTQREANLQDALGKAMTSGDRPNGTDEDQVTLRDYIKSQSVDPKNVIAVDVSGGGDNPLVTVFYKGPSAGMGSQTGKN